MVFYQTFADYEALTPAECAAKFTEAASNSGLIALGVVLHTFSG